MDKTKALTLREQLQAHLMKFGDEHGLSVNIGNGSMTSSTVSFKVEIAEIGESGEVLSRERQDFVRYASTYGLAADNLDKTFSRDGMTYKVIGLLPSSHKYPILCEIIQTQKRVKFSSDTIKYLLQRNA